MGSTSKEPMTTANFFGFEKLQERTAILFCLLASILMVLLAASDYFLGLNMFIVFLKLGMTIPFLGGYFLIRKLGLKPLQIHILLLFAIVGIYFNFVNNDGYQGPTIYTFFIFMIIFSVLLRGWSRIVWFIGSLTFYISIFYLDIYGKLDTVSNYTDENSVFLDHFITILWSSIFIFICLYIFIDQYRKQTETLNELRANQQKNLDEIQQINDQKNRLLALLSHDMKNPIGTLSTTLSLVDEEGFEEGELEQILGSLKQQTYHLNNVLNNTLSYVLTELESGHAPLEEVNVFSFTKGLQKSLQVQANEKSQTISLNFLGSDTDIFLEVNEVSIILKNLLDNAIKFSNEKETIYFNVDVTKERVRWSVVNVGIEIPQAHHEELFKLKVKPSFGTKLEKGTGLGLPLSKKIAESTNMTLGFESNSSKTTFHLEKSL